MRRSAQAVRMRLGVMLHDVGKIVHSQELDGPGAEHEPAGERLLLDHGVSLEVARMCLSHAGLEQRVADGLR
jgi:hypothetical protein